MDYYKTGNFVSTLIETDDEYSLALAKKYSLVRANTCGSRIRFIGKPARFNRFIKEINKCD